MTSGSGILTLKVGKFIELVLWEMDSFDSTKKYYDISIDYNNTPDKMDLTGYNEEIERFSADFMNTPGIVILKFTKLFNLLLDISNEEDVDVVSQKIESYKEDEII